MDLPENAIFIIVFLIIGFIRWLMENAGKKNQPPEPEHWEEYDYEERADTVTPESQTGSLEDLYEDARREILQRQNRNAPEPEVLKEKLKNYQSPPPPPLPTIAREVTKVAKTPPPTAEATPYQIKKVRRPSLTPAEQQALVNFESMGQKKAPLSASNNRIRKLLSNPTSARDAIILAEIFSKPKGA